MAEMNSDMKTEKIDLVSLVLTLRPRALEPAGDQMPRWWGRAAHALLLNLVQQDNPALAAELHSDSQGPRPFTTSTMMGRLRGGLNPDQTYSLRLTSYEAGLSAILLKAAQNSGRLSPGQTLELDHRQFEIEAACWDNSQNPWAGTASYEGISAAYLLASRPPARSLDLQFASPTTFKSAGKHLPVPLPDLVFGSLLDRWNACAPLTFPAEARRYAAECLAIGRYRLSSRAVPFKNGALRVGAVGQVRYTSLNFDRYWLSVISVLADFARYAGVGAGTSQGLGQCRRSELFQASRSKPPDQE